MRKFVPAYEGNLRKHALSVPRCISECSGIRVFGRRIKSLVFSTDVAIIKNINADAIIAVYPFTPQPAITQAIIGVSEVPVFCGVGGGLTNGVRSASMAAYVEHQGAYGVVCNSKIGVETIHAIKDAVEIPVVYTVISEKTDIQPYLTLTDGNNASPLRQSFFFFIRHVYRLFEQHLNEIGATGLGPFFVIQVLLEHLIAHLVSSFLSGNSFHRNSSSFWTNSFGRPRGLAMRYQARKVRFPGSVSCR